MSRSPARRALAVAMFLTALVVAACGDDDPVQPNGEASPTTSAPGAEPSPTTPAPTPSLRTITVSVEGGATANTDRTETVRRGERIRIEVTADVTDEVHVHTYDVLADVAPGRPAVLELTADIPGVHEVELEESGLGLFDLRVEP